MRQYLADVLRDSEVAEPAIRVAALLHVSRVVAVFDRSEAVVILAKSLTSLLSLHERAQMDLADRALGFGVAVEPQRARTLLKTLKFRGNFRERHLHHVVQTMLDHGHVTESVDFLIEWEPEGPYPFHMAAWVMARAARPRILRSLMRGWKASPSGEFFSVFSRHWRDLTAEEARSTVREMLAFTMHEADRAANVEVWVDTKFTSERDWRIFQILNVLRSLEPEVADSLIESRAELRSAASRFPFGFDSIDEEAKARRPLAPAGGGFVYAGPPGQAGIARKLMEADRAGDIEPLLDQAFRAYDEDTDQRSPNLATRACWPSMVAFNHALYVAGKTAAQETDIDRVPEPMRLLPRIEFAAGRSGLPEMRLSQMSYRPHAQ